MKENKILKWALIFSIVTIANLFFNYSLSLIFNAPNYEDVCPYVENQKTASDIIDKETCESKSGIWERYPASKGDSAIASVSGYCDLNTICNKNFNDLEKVYEKKVFVVLFILGLLILILSFFIKKNHTLGSALAITAVLDFVIASVRYWQYSDKLLKVSLLFVVLVVLIYLAIKKFNNQ